MLALLLLLTAATLGATIAPSREPLPAREVERGLVLPKGWTELEVSVRRKRADERWSAGGDPLDLGAVYTLFTERVALRHGVAPGHELWLAVPWHQAMLDGAEPLRESGLGDVAFGWRVGLLRREPPSTAIVVNVAWEGATADAGPRLPLGAGASELWLGVAGRRQLGGLAFTARVDVAHRIASRVRYLDEPAVLDPGDLVAGELEALLQGGPILLRVAPRIVRRAAARTGPARGSLETVEGTDGTTLDLRLGAALALTRAVELGYEQERPLVGEDFAFGFVEELHPTRGTTHAGVATVRF